MSEDVRNMMNKISSLNKDVLFHGSKKSELVFNDRNENIMYNMMGFGYYLTNKKEEAIYYAKDNNTDGYLYTIKLLSFNGLNYNKPIPNDIKISMSNDNGFYNLFKSKFNENNFNFENYSYVDGNFNIGWDYIDEDKPSWGKDMAVGFYIIDENKNTIIDSGLEKNDIINFIKKQYNENNVIIDKIELNNNQEYDAFYNATTKVDFLTKENLFDNMHNLQIYLYLKFKSLKLVSKYLVGFNIDGIINDIDTNDENFNSIVTVVFNPSKMEIISKDKINN